MPADQIHLRARDRPPRDDSGRFARLSCTKDTGLPALTRTYPLTDRSCNTLPPGRIPASPPSQWRISTGPPNAGVLRPTRPTEASAPSNNPGAKPGAVAPGTETPMAPGSTAALGVVLGATAPGQA